VRQEIAFERTQLDDRGTLDLLRHGVELLGLRKPLQLAQFKPALAMNPALEARYLANRLRVLRQVHYPLHHENSLDLTLFLFRPSPSPSRRCGSWRRPRASASP
jgi:hypothetical protein